jgi:hypothetical protein
VEHEHEVARAVALQQVIEQRRLVERGFDETGEPRHGRHQPHTDRQDREHGEQESLHAATVATRTVADLDRR